MTSTEFETILSAVFQEEALPRQPHYLIQIAPDDAILLRQAYAFIKSKTIRGRRLEDYPLSVVVLDRGGFSIEKELTGIPHTVIQIADSRAETINQALENHGIDGTKLGLFIDFTPACCINYRSLQPFHGVIRQGKEALIQHAQFGLFPRQGLCFSHPDSFLSHLELRHYTAREPEEGLLIFEKEGKELGKIESIRVSCIDSIVKEEGITKLHDPKGPILHNTSFTCSWEHEEEFLEFFLQQAFCKEGVTHISAVLACQNYPGKDIISMESYVQELIQEKGSADIVTKMHVAHGAEIQKCLPGYRPEDKKNLGYGVLVSYTKGARFVQPKEQVKGVISFEKEFTPESIENRIEQIILGFNVRYDKDKTFSELGLDFLQQLEFRKILCDEFLLDLASNLFVLFPTPRQLITHLIEIKLKPFKEWFYETVWNSTPKPDVKPLEPKRTWAIYTDYDEKIATGLQELFHEYSLTCVFNTLPRAEALAGVIYLKTISAKMELEAAIKTAINPLVELVNQMAETKGEFAPRLYVVTQSILQDASDQTLAEWSINPLCKIIREEYPKFQCTFVGLDPTINPLESAEALFDEIRSQSFDSQVAFRYGQRLVPSLIRSDVQRVRTPSFSPKASYLIAGGARTLGLLLARWYYTHGARHLVLLDELDLTPYAKAQIGELEKLDVDITYCKVNVTDEEAIKAVLDKLPYPLAGLIHAAGVVDNDLLIHMNWDRFTSVHRLKITLSWILHKLTSDRNLDHFILFSSALADLAPLAKANHATGNGFLDALSYFRRKQGLAALSINWGPWELRHMEVRHVVESSLSDRVKMITIDEGLKVLDNLFFVTKPQIMAAVVNWPAVLQSMPNPLFDEIADELGYKRMALLKSYYKAQEDTRETVLTSYLHERIRKLLKLASAQQLESTREFYKMGVDLQKQQMLKNQIERDLGNTIKLPFDLIDDSSTLQKLAASLKGILDAQAPAGSYREVLSEELLSKLSQMLKAGGKLPEIVILPD